MGFFTGIQLYGKAFGILFSRKFWWFLLFPVIILLLLFIGGNILISLAGDSLYGLIEAKLTAWVGGISWLQWVTTTTSVLIKIVLRILYFFLFVAFGGYIVLVVMSPVYSWLSERTEAHLTGREFPFSFRQFAWEIFRGILIALRNMIFQLFIDGWDVQTAAERSFVSVATVRKHNTSINRKLEVSNREELMVYVDLFRRCGRLEELKNG